MPGPVWHRWRSLLPVALVIAFLGLECLGPRSSAGEPARDDADAKAVVTLPPERGGQDMVGRRFPEMSLRWAAPPAESFDPAEPVGATLYRWWTDSCRHCRASLPAVERLRKKYGPEGLRVVAVYHPKPPGPADEERVRRRARSLGYDGPVAVDADWSQLRRAYLDHGRRNATSVAMLVDRKGVVRFVHPGPAFFPSADPAHATANADYRALEEAVRTLLRKRPESPG